MRRLVTILFTTLILTQFVLPALGQATQAPEQTPEMVIRSFYKWYVDALNKNIDPFTKRRTTLSKYVTRRLIVEIDKAVKGPDGLDGDYFLDAQDWDKDWGNNIEISDMVNSGAQATATVKLSGKDMFNRRLKIVLKKEANIWKIDKVKGLDD